MGSPSAYLLYTNITGIELDFFVKNLYKNEINLKRKPVYDIITLYMV